MSAILTLANAYYVLGALVLGFALLTVLDAKHPKRWGTAAFWGLLGIVIAFGGLLPPEVVGAIIVALAVLAAFNAMGRGNYDEAPREARVARAQALGLWLFAPALVIPIVTFAYAYLFPRMPTPPLVGLALAAVAAFVAALAMTRERPVQAIQEGRRLIDSISWAAILPPFLAALGALFAEARVGDLIAAIARAVVAPDSRLAVVATYCVAMAVFTAIMGNAFAAFAVITAGIGVPLLIVGQGGDPVVIGVIGMLSGFCGTLTTPMAANFNIVPAALLELKDKNAVIRAQIPTAIPLLIANIVLMYFLGFSRAGAP
jgi:uncharacterized membrane protein